jgi:hypothetical protein
MGNQDWGGPEWPLWWPLEEPREPEEPEGPREDDGNHGDGEDSESPERGWDARGSRMMLGTHAVTWPTTRGPCGLCALCSRQCAPCR